MHDRTLASEHVPCPLDSAHNSLVLLWALLDRHDIAHEPGSAHHGPIIHGPLTVRASTGITELPDGLRVRGNLDCAGSGMTRLPARLTVEGSLDLERTSVSELPENVCVHGDIFLKQSGIRHLPPSLRISGNLWLQLSHITSLPANLRVGGSLYLRDTPIAVLPEGLVVEGDLDLGNTAITRLPKTMRVGGRIFPPHGLADIAAFMADKEGRVELSLKGSQHHQMAVRAQMQQFPDLARVVESLGRWALHMTRDSLEGQAGHGAPVTIMLVR